MIPIQVACKGSIPQGARKMYHQITIVYSDYVILLNVSCKKFTFLSQSGRGRQLTVKQVINLLS